MVTTMVTTMDRPTTDEQTTKQRTLITGGDPDEPYDIPFFTDDFCEAPDLEVIGQALIKELEEFADIVWAIEEGALVISWVWKKKGAKADGKIRTGALAKTGGMVKHFSGASYVIGLSADANRIRTCYQIEAEIYHQLTHIRIEKKWVGKGEDKVMVPVLQKRSHDFEFFASEVARYGYWRSELKQAAKAFAQLGLDGMGS